MNACLLHRDYHEMTHECWQYVVSWFMRHQHVPEEWRRDLYQQAVESAILGDMWKVRAWT